MTFLLQRRMSIALHIASFLGLCTKLFTLSNQHESYPRILFATPLLFILLQRLLYYCPPCFRKQLHLLSIGFSCLCPGFLRSFCFLCPFTQISSRTDAFTHHIPVAFEHTHTHTLSLSVGAWIKTIYATAEWFIWLKIKAANEDGKTLYFQWTTNFVFIWNCQRTRISSCVQMEYKGSWLLINLGRTHRWILGQWQVENILFFFPCSCPAELRT